MGTAGQGAVPVSSVASKPTATPVSEEYLSSGGSNSIAIIVPIICGIFIIITGLLFFFRWLSVVQRHEEEDRVRRARAAEAAATAINSHLAVITPEQLNFIPLIRYRKKRRRRADSGVQGSSWNPLQNVRKKNASASQIHSFLASSDRDGSFQNRPSYEVIEPVDAVVRAADESDGGSRWWWPRRASAQQSNLATQGSSSFREQSASVLRSEQSAHGSDRMPERPEPTLTSNPHASENSTPGASNLRVDTTEEFEIPSSGEVDDPDHDEAASIRSSILGEPHPLTLAELDPFLIQTPPPAVPAVIMLDASSPAALADLLAADAEGGMRNSSRTVTPSRPRTPNDGSTDLVTHASHASSISSSVLQRWTQFDTCSICLEPFESGLELRELLGCKHLFHPECLDVWMTRRSASCPLCRMEMVPLIREAERVAEEERTQNVQGRQRRRSLFFSRWLFGWNSRIPNSSSPPNDQRPLNEGV
ncbi:hypothetical protein BJ742DRAFT_843612 [Cladochytrium replicatum]|nr:hypothetical protein BJ742DRAFT_843612 [Cladochytrium replicatum]